MHCMNIMHSDCPHIAPFTALLSSYQFHFSLQVLYIYGFLFCDSQSWTKIISVGSNLKTNLWCLVTQKQVHNWGQELPSSRIHQDLIVQQGEIWPGEPLLHLWWMVEFWRSPTKDLHPSMQSARAFIISRKHPACWGRPSHTKIKWWRHWEESQTPFKHSQGEVLRQ